MGSIMRTTNRGSLSMSRNFSRAVWHLGLTLAGGLLIYVAALGQGPPAQEPVEGLFITVPQPLDKDSLNWVKAQTEDFLNRKAGRLKIVYDFNPEDRPVKSDDFDICSSLAKYLLGEKLASVTTIAFVHGPVEGHKVLPALACREVVLGTKGKLGPVVDAQTPTPDKIDLARYVWVAEKRGLFPAVVLKMVDKDVNLLEGQSKNGPCYIDGNRLNEEVAKNGFNRESGRPVPGFAHGQTEGYNHARALKYGLCKNGKPLDSWADLKAAYDLPDSSLRGDALQGQPPVAGRIRLSGLVTPGMKEGIVQSLKQAVSRGTNLIFVQLEDCHGGDTETARQIADFLRDLKDDLGKAPVKTVAYYGPGARDTATIIAFGCTEIVMHKDAQLGQFDDLVKKRDNLAWAVDLQDLAKKQGYSPLLARGMLEPELVIQLAQHKHNIRQLELMEPEEIQKSQDWAPQETIKKEGELLSLDSKQAQKLHVAHLVYDPQAHVDLIPWLQDQYGVKSIPEIPFGWLHHLATFLRSPEVSYFLVIVGITGLILELKIPGFGFPGVLAAICFVLYFWAHSQQMEGSLTMLAVLLFVLGLILIGVEVFLVPGLGITGISGIVLILVSLGLVTLVKKPETTHEWLEFGTTLTTLGGCLVAALVGAMLAAYYLPHIPWANRLVLAPPFDQLRGFEEEPRGPNYTALIGTIGEAATTLRPAGKALFGDEYLDVIAEGSYVVAGARVQIIEVEGNRVVVKEV